MHVNLFWSRFMLLWK